VRKIRGYTRYMCESLGSQASCLPEEGPAEVLPTVYHRETYSTLGVDNPNKKQVMGDVCAQDIGNLQGQAYLQRKAAKQQSHTKEWMYITWEGRSRQSIAVFYPSSIPLQGFATLLLCVERIHSPQSGHR